MGEPPKPEQYSITLGGQIASGWSEWLGGLSIQTVTTPHGQPLTVLSGPIPDQAALRGILNQVWDLNLELIAVERIAI